MTKWITILIIAVVLYGGWQLFLYYDRVKSEDEEAQKKAAVTENISPQQLFGMPSQLEQSLDAAHASELNIVADDLWQFLTQVDS